MVTLRETITKLVKDFDIKGDNDSGQNFLVDENVLETEINEAHLISEDTILDIGAGFGSIETKASKKCHVIAIERDIKCYSYLIDKYEINANIQVVNADALDIIYPEFTKIVSNPPYNIADRIIEKISHYDFADSIMILPKTMADELCSIQSHTAFSAINKLFMEFSKIMEVERTSFYPEPRVTSVMVRIKKKEKDILQDTFRRREMTLKNAIRNAVISIDKKTKRQSKESLSKTSEDIRKFWDKQVKSLNFEEIKTVIDNLK